MSREHTIREDIHARTIAGYYGFRSLDALEGDNAALAAKRGGLDQLEPGDVVAIPDGRAGIREVGTGRVHEISLRAGVTVLELRLYTEFRHGNSEEDKALTTTSWGAWGSGSRGIFQLEATVSIRQTEPAGPSRPAKTTNSGTGVVQVAGLANGMSAKLFLDFSLAMLVKGAERAAQRMRERERPDP